MLSRVKDIWSRFAAAASRVNTFIILFAVFFLVLVPLGLLFRLFGKSVLSTPPAASLWTPRSGSSQMERPF